MENGQDAAARAASGPASVSRPELVGRPTLTAERRARAGGTRWRARGGATDHPRLDVLLRLIAGIPLAYAAAALWAMAGARLLPGDATRNTVAATLTSFAMCAAAAMWAWAARSGWRALWTTGLAGIAGAALWWASLMTSGPW